MFQMSTSGPNSCLQPKSSLINRLMIDRPFVSQTLPQLIDRHTPVVLPRFCNQQDWSQIMLRSHRFGAVMKSGILRQISFRVVCTTRYASVLCCWNLSWLSSFDFMQNVKYACDKKFTEVYSCKKIQNRSWFHKVIIKWCSFFIHCHFEVMTLRSYGVWLYTVYGVYTVLACIHTARS